MSIARFQFMTILSWFLLVPLVSLCAQTPGISIDVAVSEVVFGDFLEVEVRRIWPVDAKVSPWRDEDVGLENVATSVRKKTNDGEFVTETILVRGRVFTVDLWKLESVGFTYRIPGMDDGIRLESQPFAVPVVSSLTSHDEEHLELPRDPYTIVGLHRPHGGILLVVSILFFGLAYFLVRRCRSLDVFIESEEDTILALQNTLKKLMDESLVGGGTGECISLILRNFLRRSIAIPALELTPAEILQELRTKPNLLAADTQCLFDLLTICDEEKYGQVEVGDGEWSEVIARSISLVERILDVPSSDPNKENGGGE